MIVLDTNVVSEPLRPVPAQAVVDWLDAQSPATLYLTTVCLAELFTGVAALPSGRRRTTLEKALAAQVVPLFDGRILPFDREAAQVFARVHAGARRAGNPISFPDCAIAAIAAFHGFFVATRNVRDFRGTGVQTIDPWA